MWIAAVLLVDVAHVWASLYRTYLDAGARQRLAAELTWTPLLVGWFGFLLHLESPLLFWGALAYVAIHHFIKQHLGFVLLYLRKADEPAIERAWARAAVLAGTAGPVVWWHAHLPREFAWFMDGDLMEGAPAWLGTAALGCGGLVLAAFFGRRVALGLAGRRNPMVPLLVGLPALNWHLGIVVFDDDRVFTVTNVLLHGVPYLALVWIAGGAARVRAGLGEARARWPAVVLAAYYGLLVVLATAEEALWDRLVWHDHPELFGAAAAVERHPVAMAAIVAALSVPQATHYVLDRWIWRAGPRNPELAAQLGFTRSDTVSGRPAPPAATAATAAQKNR
jgi:hypothetical protein